MQAFVEAKVSLISEETKEGPDGWPYLYVKTAPDSTEPVPRVLQWLSERGIGLAVNPHKMLPDYIFPYGLIWNYRETGQFVSNQDAPAGDTVIYKKEENWLFGPPAEKFLPGYVRRVLREYFMRQEIEPKILVATSPDYRQIDLLFSLESLGSPKQQEHKKIADAIAWFLPIHYSLVLASESGMPKFVDL